jgi:hypothetical protein
MDAGFEGSSPHKTRVKVWRGNGRIRLTRTHPIHAFVTAHYQPSLAREACRTRSKGPYNHKGFECGDLWNYPV